MLEDEGADDPYSGSSKSEGQRSLFADIEALIDDGRTFVEAEIAFQKARIAYAGSKGRSAAILLLLAALFGCFALFALVVGLVIALAPLLTAWGATALIAGILILAAGFCAIAAAANVRQLRAAFRKDKD